MPYDKRDLQIMTLLQENGRMRNQALAEAVGISPSACLARVRRLEDEGYISGYRAVIDVEKLRDVVIVFAEVTLESQHPAAIDTFERAIADVPQIVAAAQISGDYDYLLQVVVPSMTAWLTLMDGLLGSAVGIAKMKTLVRLKEGKRFPGFPLSMS